MVHALMTHRKVYMVRVTDGMSEWIEPFVYANKQNAEQRIQEFYQKDGGHSEEWCEVVEADFIE